MEREFPKVATQVFLFSLLLLLFGQPETHVLYMSCVWVRTLYTHMYTYSFQYFLLLIWWDKGKTILKYVLMCILCMMAGYTWAKFVKKYEENAQTCEKSLNALRWIWFFFPLFVGFSVDMHRENDVSLYRRFMCINIIFFYLRVHYEILLK